MLIYVSLLVALIGALIYLLVERPKIAELGRLAFACGLLAFLLKITESMIGLLGGGH